MALTIVFDFLRQKSRTFFVSGIDKLFIKYIYIKHYCQRHFFIFKFLPKSLKNSAGTKTDDSPTTQCQESIDEEELHSPTRSVSVLSEVRALSCWKMTSCRYTQIHSIFLLIHAGFRNSWDLFVGRVAFLVGKHLALLRTELLRYSFFVTWLNGPKRAQNCAVSAEKNI